MVPQLISRGCHDDNAMHMYVLVATIIPGYTRYTFEIGSASECMCAAVDCFVVLLIIIMLSIICIILRRMHTPRVYIYFLSIFYA